MIKFHKPKFWDKKKISLIAILFYPFSIITLLIIFLKKKILNYHNFKIPVICVGNIYIGGTGKTPTSILIAKELSEAKIKPVILRKYYKSHVDEYNLIRNNFSNLIIKKNRILGISEAEKKGYDVVILDDGLQDYKIKKKLSIVCFNQNQLIGNGLILPSGPLRESLKTLKNASIIIINGKIDKEFEKKILIINKNLEIYYSYYNPINLDEFKNHDLLAIAGIANPENFFELLKKNSLIVREKLTFPDHYIFSKNDLQAIINLAKEKNLKIIMTEKDYFKINDHELKNFNYLKVSLEIKNKEKLIERIKKLNA